MTYQIEQRGRATVGFLRGHRHQRYEDRYRLLTGDIPMVAQANRGELFAVFDGMGSLRQGMHAAQFMVDLLIEFFEHPEVHAATGEDLERLLLSGSRHIHQWGEDSDTRNPVGGCVGTVVWLHRGMGHVLHLGDTEGWISGQPGSAAQITKPHTVDGRLAAFYGMDGDPQLQIASFPFESQSRLLLTTDGLRKIQGSISLDHRVGGREPPETVVREICQLAESRQARDDVTVLIMTGS